MSEPILLDFDGDAIVEMHGEALTGIGIHPDDQLVIKQQDTAENEQLVLATVRGEALVRRYHRDGDTITLKPEHPAIEALVAPASDVRILGLVTGVIRSIK